MEMKLIKISINCIAVILHISSLTSSICCFFLILYRWNFNLRHRQHASIISTSSFDDSISLLLFAYSYFISILYSAAWLSILIHTIAGDFAILPSIFYLGDSLACRARIAMIFLLTSAFFHSYLLQAFRCLSKLVYHSTLHKRKICSLSLDHVSTYILLILSGWFISLLLLIPAATTLNVFSYFPEQYHCLISFTNVRGFTYSLLVTYIIPVLFIVYIYIRLITFIHRAFNSKDISRANREIQIVKRILTICSILSFCGSPTIFFLLQFIVIGRVHPLADRVHELGIAISANIVTFGFAFLSTFTKLLPTKSAIQN